VIDDDDIEVRTAAIIALGEIGGKEAKNALLGRLEQSDPITREAVEEALAVIELYDGPLSLSM
jgi:HEAT repeat protein